MGSGWKVKLRKKWKIRKIVVRFEPRTLAAGQATPNYFAYTSPVKIPGSSLSWTTPSPASPLRSAIHTRTHLLLVSGFSPLPSLFLRFMLFFWPKFIAPLPVSFCPARPTLRKLRVKKCKMKYHWTRIFGCKKGTGLWSTILQLEDPPSFFLPSPSLLSRRTRWFARIDQRGLFLPQIVDKSRQFIPIVYPQDPGISIYVIRYVYATFSASIKNRPLFIRD